MKSIYKILERALVAVDAKASDLLTYSFISMQNCSVRIEFVPIRTC